jgi:hypothetical protein
MPKLQNCLKGFNLRYYCCRSGLSNGPCQIRDMSVGLFSMLAYLYGATDAPDVLEYCISKVGTDLLLIPGLRLKA